MRDMGNRNVRRTAVKNRGNVGEWSLYSDDCDYTDNSVGIQNDVVIVARTTCSLTFKTCHFLFMCFHSKAVYKH